MVDYDPPSGPTQPGGGLSAPVYQPPTVPWTPVGNQPGSATPTPAPAAPTNPATAPGAPMPGPNAPAPGGYNPGDIIIGSGGQMGVYGRHYDPQTGAYTYGFLYYPQPGTPEFEQQGGWTTIEQQTGISAPFLQSAYQTAYTSYQSSQAQATKLGQYTILGLSQGANGEAVFKLEKGDGSIVELPESQIVGNPTFGNLTQSDIDQAKSSWASAKANLTRLGNFQVVGLNDDDSMVVMKGDGTTATVTRAQVAAGLIPGVSASDFDQAASSFQSAKSNLARGGQWSFKGIDPKTGMVQIQNNGTSEIKTVSAQEASGYAGVNPLEVQQAQTQMEYSNWQGANAFGPQTFGLPTNSAQPPNPTPQPPTPPPAYGTPNPMPPPNPGGAPPLGTPTTPIGRSVMPQTPQGYAQSSQQYMQGGVGKADGFSPVKYPMTPGQQAQYSASGLGAGKAEGMTPSTGVMKPTTTPYTPTPAPQTPPSYGSSAGNIPNWTNQQIGLANQSYQNAANYIRQSNIGSKNLSGMGFSAIGRPQIAGQ